MSSAIIAPASNAIGDGFGIHSSFLKQLNFSIILLAYVIGPLVLAPLCEVYGRVIVLQLANMYIAYALLPTFRRVGVNNVLDSSWSSTLCAVSRIVKASS